MAMEILRKEEMEEPLPAPPIEKKEVVVKATTAQPFYVHHAMVGLAVMIGGTVGATFCPSLKTETRIMVAGLSLLMGGILLYDDLTQHWEHGCSLDTIWNFLPCPENVAPVVVKKP